MRKGTPGFRPERLVEARKARGVTQVTLASLIGKASSNISRWENTDQTPEPEALEALASALGVPMAFFLRPVQDHGAAPIYFRSMASTTLQLRDRSCARLRWLQDISLALQEWVDLPEVNVPCVDTSCPLDLRDGDIEAAAMACRERWGLGKGPISDSLLVLENAGVVVAKDETGSVKMDGLSNWSMVDNRPYMLIARDKDSCARSRLDALHELGHLVLHRNLPAAVMNKAEQFKEVERQAYVFAGAFLMPAESFAAEVWSPSLNTFLALKERWRASVGAMIKRCAQLGMISDGYQKQLWKYYGGKGWRGGEPLDDTLPLESPRLMARSVTLLIDSRVRTREDLLADFRLPAYDVEMLCGLPRGYMTAKPADVMVFPKVKRHGSGGGSADGSKVIPLRRT